MSRAISGWPIATQLGSRSKKFVRLSLFMELKNRKNGVSVQRK